MDTLNTDNAPASGRSLKAFTLDELTALVADYGEPAYRARQLHEWLHTHHASTFDEMTTLPKALRAQLSEAYTIAPPEVVSRLEAADGAVKYLLRFGDATAETVALPTGRRLTVCFSTQAGCAMGCVFCATGGQGFVRNLSAVEMVDQLAVVQRDIAASAQGDMTPRITNAVAMGQGEPFANYDAVLGALRRMNDPAGFGIGARRLTVSTCGLIAGIQRFAQEPEQFGLAVSLHSAIQSVRDFLMPGLRNQPLAALKAALLDYQTATHRRVTLEYTLIAGVNDDEDALEALREFCGGGLFHVNLLPLHPVENSALKPSDSAIITRWLQRLTAAGIATSLRQSRGVDIAGACGQLANRL